jgi:hypothetical protein
MWIKTYSVITTKVTADQMWALFSDVNNWHTWDQAIEFARLDGPFKQGAYFTLKPKGGPKVKVELLEVQPNRKFVDMTRFPLAKMYDHHEFELTPDGLKITNTISVRGILAFLWIKLVAQKIVAALPTDVEQQILAAQKL